MYSAVATKAGSSCSVQSPSGLTWTVVITKSRTLDGFSSLNCLDLGPQAASDAATAQAASRQRVVRAVAFLISVRPFLVCDFGDDSTVTIRCYPGGHRRNLSACATDGGTIMRELIARASVVTFSSPRRGSGLSEENERG
jgi:hypothetical protein